MKALPLAVALALAGCGGGGPGAPTPEAAAVPVTLETGPVVFMGDSITAHWDDAAYATPLLSALVPGEVNAGVSGQTSTQMRARFGTDVLARHARAVIIEAGINDIGSGTVDTAGTIANISAMAEDASAEGTAVFIAAIVAAVPPTWTPEKDAQITELNTELRSLCAVYGYTFVDYYAATEVDGKPAPALFEWDATHPDAAGYQAMWSYLKPKLDKVLP